MVVRLSAPGRKTGDYEIPVKCQRFVEPFGFHYRKADRVRIGNCLIVESAKPCTGTFMVLGPGEHDLDLRATAQMVHGGGGRFYTRAEQQQPMNLGKHEICGYQALPRL